MAHTAFNDKRRAQLNCLSHILRFIPYKKVSYDLAELPKRSNKAKYDDDRALIGRRIIPQQF